MLSLFAVKHHCLQASLRRHWPSSNMEQVRDVVGVQQALRFYTFIDKASHFHARIPKTAELSMHKNSHAPLWSVIPYWARGHMHLKAFPCARASDGHSYA